MRTRLIRLLPGALLVASLVAAKAEGYINVFPYNANSAYGRGSLISGQLVGSNFCGQLVGGTSPGALSWIGTPVHFKTGSGVSAIDGGNVIIPGTNNVGTAYYYALRVWDGQ